MQMQTSEGTVARAGATPAPAREKNGELLTANGSKTDAGKFEPNSESPFFSTRVA